MNLKGMKIFILGERDGVSAPAIAECMKASEAKVLYMDTQCFVWTAAGAMDQVVQGEIKKAAEIQGKENMIVVLGSPDADSADIYAETVTLGDPTYAGSLGGVSLELQVYHILEDEIKEAIPKEVYEEQVGLMELSLDKEGICDAMQKAREKLVD